jgi:hypothetical protein
MITAASRRSALIVYPISSNRDAIGPRTRPVRVPASDVGAVGKWRAEATLTSQAAAGHSSTAPTSLAGTRTLRPYQLDGAEVMLHPDPSGLYLDEAEDGSFTVIARLLFRLRG